jgi:GNAT superfamily N-acetyltransferase
VSVEIREARAGDGAALARIWLENARYYVSLFPDDFCLPDDEGEIAAAIDESLEHGRAESSVLLVAEVDGEVAASCSAHIEEPSPNASRQMLPELGERRAWVDSLGTGDAFQRRGVATALVHAVEEWARSRGATSIEAETYLASPVSIPFWESRMGYRRRSVKLTKRL